ncbi:MAG: PspA/IM30 family protein [Candidatus Sericytochromatia bacterium]|nr:PspA/IM30 family protein [Candidatus Sericytochromatia bacterium]
MGIFERLTTVIKSNINDMIDKAEDPEKMLKQLMIDMEKDLIEVRKEVALAIQTEKRLHQQYSQNAKQAEGWEEKATLALKSGREDLAREALTRRNTYQQTAEGFKAQWETQNANVEVLKKQLGQLEGKINEARIKKDLLVARSRQAKAQQQIHQTMGKIGTSRSMSAFARMEDKVMEKEALAAAYGDMSLLDGGNNLEDQFAQLSAGSGVDDDLAALKAKLDSGS